MLLYGHEDSGHAYKVRLFLLMAQVAHEYQRIDLSQPRAERPVAFQAVSKFGEVPVLMNGEQVLCQSNAILMHLAQKTGQFSGAEGEWQTIVEWLFWEPNRINFAVPNLRFAKRWAPQPEPVIDYLTQRALADLATLDRHLASQTYLLPSGFSIADISCASYLHWADEAGLDLQPFLHVRRWLSDMSQLPHWQHPYLAQQAS
ncbi:glutathione S-transferase family protein [Hydrogenophaga sp. PAMC20947]|uniref:glutathione S-transferase family protein n=1 Tax=Hydrogenophaga sp. PAMC20947 TaxID=2565558 RepID=UPI00109DE0FC|nr:glutathione S-transferase family protein [Hydrogenophaga sp. PAMC20947]QCB44953.1 glutathione S-transferase family protein [Hydrogenophaga sp. PAMC20947]